MNGLFEDEPADDVRVLTGAAMDSEALTVWLIEHGWTVSFAIPNPREITATSRAGKVRRFIRGDGGEWRIEQVKAS